MRTLILIALLLFPGLHGLAAVPTSGLYFDRQRDGHGLDLQIIGERVVGTVFTYEQDGQPIWYLLEGQWSDSGADLELVEYRYQPDAVPAATVHARFPGARMQRALGPADCGSGSERPGATALYDFRFALEGESLRWCLEPLVPTSSAPQSALSGSWYGGEDDGGWGLISYLYEQNGSVQSFHTLYVYDAAGRPRWAFASLPADDTNLQPQFQFIRGYCRQCVSQPLDTVAAGSAAVRLVTPRNDVEHNRIALDLRYPFGVGGDFVRSERPLRLIAANPAPAGVVASSEGLVRGSLQDGIAQFLGLPYVAPVVGELRWRAPQAALPRSVPLDAIDAGPACPQKAVGDGVFPVTVGTIAEDCLQLNVWSPQLGAEAQLPVMLWIHGGGLSQGSAVERRGDGGLFYDGGALAREGVVLVSINYRLGPLGYLAMREFANEHAEHPSSANLGLLDQIAALHWVRANIAGFGGDPARITVFGESAGGVSTCALMNSPLAQGLFQRAIIQSGDCSRSLPALESTPLQAGGYVQGSRLIEQFGCAGSADVRACMRALPWQQIIDLSQPTVGFGRSGEDFGLLLDGRSVIEPPASSMAAGRQAPIPVIFGVNADEMTTLLPPSQRPATAAAYQALVMQSFPGIGALVLAQYPVSAYPEPWYAWADLVDDLAFACRTSAHARRHAEAGFPTWRYVYTHVYAGPSAVYGAFHGGELGFVFGPQPPFTLPERDLTGQIQRQWTRFAASGDPNGGDGNSGNDPAWPQRLENVDTALELAAARRGLIGDYRASYCAFWSRYVSF